MKKEISIYMSQPVPVGALAFRDVKEAIAKGQQSIVTTCLNFFCFDYLNKGYDVTVYDGDGYISLAGLLENTGEYTDKEIRIAHNAPKMLIAGAFNFKKSETPLGDNCVDVNEVIRLHVARRHYNTLGHMKDVKFYYDGELKNVTQYELEEFSFTGLSNLDFFTMRDWVNDKPIFEETE